MGKLYDIVKSSGGNAKAYLYGITNITRENRIPYTMYLQLLPYCNLKCKMCYARMEPEEVNSCGLHVMRFEEWKYFIDEGVKLGTRTVALTGGECTIHPDFCNIYSYAYDLGMDIYVMTNLTNVTDDIFELWAKKPPFSISFTVYGATADTYESLCGNGKMCAVVYNNIPKLLNAGQTLFPKFNIVQENYHDLDAVTSYFNSLNLKVNYGGTLMNFGKCNSVTLEEEEVDSDLISDFFFKKWCIDHNKTFDEGKEAELRRLQKDYLNNGTEKKDGLKCGAARNTCHINWKGEMTPCVSMDAFKKDPRTIGFAECWRQMCKWADNIPYLEECSGCMFISKCRSCASYHYLDTGKFGVVSPRHCWKRNHPQEAADLETEIIRRINNYGK